MPARSTLQIEALQTTDQLAIAATHVDRVPVDGHCMRTVEDARTIATDRSRGPFGHLADGLVLPAEGGEAPHPVVAGVGDENVEGRVHGNPRRIRVSSIGPGKGPAGSETLLVQIDQEDRATRIRVRETEQVSRYGDAAQHDDENTPASARSQHSDSE
ncbi:MAG: hypothetical protein ACYTG5_13980 [Planctomycetota bacterium]